MKLFPPMLSASLEDEIIPKLAYPLLASPKLDGIRGIIWEGIAYSRNGKPLRNKFVQDWALKHHNMDGEFIVGSPTDPLCLNRTHGVMAYEGEPNFKFWLFDCREAPNGPSYQSRLMYIQEKVQNDHKVVVVPQHIVHNSHELLAMEEHVLAQGYEGLMLRSPHAPYKNGYSTLKEGYLLKLKRFVDGEAVVTSLEPAMENRNPLQRDEMGFAKRSTHQGNMVPKTMIGTLICRDARWGELRVGPGTMTHDERIAFFKNQHRIVGKTIHWRSFGYGLKDRPRFARYYGIRMDL